MTDADVDGAHIRILLLTFLFRYQRALIENRYVYIACPPLYKVSQGKTTKYAYTQEELEAVQASNSTRMSLFASHPVSETVSVNVYSLQFTNRIGLRTDPLTPSSPLILAGEHAKGEGRT